MAKSIMLEVITPERLFYMGEIELVIARTLDGDEGFMASHTWACKLLATGELWIQEKGNPNFKMAALSGGYIDVREGIVIYADTAEWPDEIDDKRAQLAKEKAENRLLPQNRDVNDIERARIALVKATNRINIKEGSGRRKTK